MREDTVEGTFITLSPMELDLAVEGSLLRDEEARKQGRKDTRGLTGSDEYKQYLGIYGLAGEIAAARALRIPYLYTVNTYRSEPDLRLPDGTPIEVKTSVTAKTLIVPLNADPHDTYVWVRGELPTLEVVGWAPGYELMNKKFISTPRGRTPIYAIQEHRLYPLELLFSKLRDSAAPGARLWQLQEEMVA